MTQKRNLERIKKSIVQNWTLNGILTHATPKLAGYRCGICIYSIWTDITIQVVVATIILLTRILSLSVIHRRCGNIKTYGI